MGQLLCTFTDKWSLLSTLSNIKNSYIIADNKIYNYDILPLITEYIYVYSVAGMKSKPLQNTMSIHRKNSLNILYTINALNCLICNSNNGILDKKYKINWENYRDSFILSNSDNSTRILKIQLREIVLLN